MIVKDDAALAAAAIPEPPYTPRRYQSCLFVDRYCPEPAAALTRGSLDGPGNEITLSSRFNFFILYSSAL